MLTPAAILACGATVIPRTSPSLKLNGTHQHQRDCREKNRFHFNENENKNLKCPPFSIGAGQAEFLTQTLPSIEIPHQFTLEGWSIENHDVIFSVNGAQKSA